MKKLFAPLLVLLLVLGLCGAGAEAPERLLYMINDDYAIDYYILPDGCVEISILRCMRDFDPRSAETESEELHIEIPSELDGYPVTFISHFFTYQASHGILPAKVVSITIPDTVSLITESALAFPDLAQIIVSADHPVYEVVDGVLFNKIDKTLVCYPPALPGESYTVPDGTIAIASRAFSNCTSLKSLTIPDSVTTMYTHSYSGYCNLEVLNLGSGFTGFSKHDLFYSSTTAPFALSTYLREINVSAANTAYRSLDGLLYSADGTTLMCCPAGREGGICLPEGVTAISRYAFEGCWNPLTITLPESLFENGEPRDIHLYPIAITDERMQQFLSTEELSSKAKRIIQETYRFIQPGTKDAQKLLASFTALADMPLWIERNAVSGRTASVRDQKRIADAFAEAGYTLDDLLTDDALLASGPRSLHPYTVVCKAAFSTDILPEGSTLIVQPDSLAYHWAKQNSVPIQLAD